MSVPFVCRWKEFGDESQLEVESISFEGAGHISLPCNRRAEDGVSSSGKLVANGVSFVRARDTGGGNARLTITSRGFGRAVGSNETSNVFGLCAK